MSAFVATLKPDTCAPADSPPIQTHAIIAIDVPAFIGRFSGPKVRDFGQQVFVHVATVSGSDHQRVYREDFVWMTTTAVGGDKVEF
jgi:hypothetical protein